MKTPTAAQAYQAAQAESEQLLKRLAKALANHAANAQSAPTNWGYVGDRNYYNGKIMECLAGLGALTDKERELHRF